MLLLLLLSVMVPSQNNTDPTHGTHFTQLPLRNKQPKSPSAPTMARLADQFSRSEEDLRSEIVAAIDHDQEQLVAFFGAMLEASGAPNASVAFSNIIRQYLSQHGIRTVMVGARKGHPSLTSLFDRSSGPCLVMGCLMLISDPSLRPVTALENGDLTWLMGRQLEIKAGIAATVAAYAYLHARQEHLDGTVVMVAFADDEQGSVGGLQHLLHDDERKELFRGDCVLSSSPDCSADNHTSALPSIRRVGDDNMQAVLARNIMQVMGTNYNANSCSGCSCLNHWRDLGIPVHSYGLAGGRIVKSTTGFESALQDDFLALVKVHALSAWDYMRLPSDGAESDFEFCP